MQHNIILPDLGQTTGEAKISRWLKRPGDHVARGEPVMIVETDKVDMEVESFESGYIREHLVAEGSMVNALEPVAILTETPDESYNSIYAKPAEPAAVSWPGQDGGAAPAGGVLAKEVGVITRADVGRFVKAREHPGLSDDERIGMFRRMLLCRMFEDRVYYLFLQGRMPGTIHQAQGQEASAVGVCAALEPGDMITSTHRPHEHAVARGIPVDHLMAELFAKANGCCHGKGGSMHVGDVAYGMLPAIAIVGSGIPLAAGYALAMKYRKTGNIVACFFGDGATNIGSFHEGVNIAAIWDLPVVFVCENNKYGASTAIEKVTRVPRLSDRAAGYGIPGRTVDGNDVEAVHSAMLEACRRAREGAGPTLLELETYRFAGHSRSDPGHYRSKDEVAYWKARDPLTRYESFLTSEGILSPSDIEGLKASVEKELDAAVAFAEAGPSPSPEDCLKDVYAV
jgi:pyruvate dehydrogenase E1 component alpha subunit